MSYCRLTTEGSTLYLYPSRNGLVCCGCSLTDGASRFETAPEFIEHLQKHLDAGDKIPAGGLVQIGMDWERWGDDPSEWYPLRGGEAKALRDALNRSPFDISPCMTCNEPTVCLPDGLPICYECGLKESN